MLVCGCSNAYVDFSNLDTEYIGILYEGLLDYDLKKATEAVVFIRMGDEPALPISDLETIAPAKLKDVFGKLQKKSQVAVAEDADEDAEDVESEDDENEATPVIAEAVDTEAPLDESDASLLRAHKWAIEAVKAANMVRRPRRQTAENQRRYELDVESAARNLFSRVVRPGDWYLVRFGNTLKVCDPSGGSGSFLISALRYLTTGLFESLYQHGRIQSVNEQTKIYDLGIGKPEHLPAGDDFDDQLQARLRRHLVERCLYGVDVNSLAIELARMSLWIETLDSRLPFGFLDHKLKVGNSLIGCWLDRFEEYPVMAWMREGGDKDYEPINDRLNSTEVLKRWWNGNVKPDLVTTITSRFQPCLFDSQVSEHLDEIQRSLGQLLEEIHSVPMEDSESRRGKYLDLCAKPIYTALHNALDTWTALWFWPADRLDRAPLPSDYLAADDHSLTEILSTVRNKYKFFHWELEFPDVFSAPDEGFDAVIGNPPWETLQPMSKEFFSNIDPLFRALGKQDALRRQRELFSANIKHEDDWLRYREIFSAAANFYKMTSDPAGKKQGLSLTRSVKQNSFLNERWASTNSRSGFSDPNHPFRLQGDGKFYTYKMFLELGYRILRHGGKLGIIVPSGIYSDQGAGSLRRLFLDEGCWDQLYSFQNERFVFEAIEHYVKVAVLHVSKTSGNGSVLTKFRLGPGDSPDLGELERDILESSQYLDVSREQIRRLSPQSDAIVELRTHRDLAILDRLYENAILLGDQSPKGWRVHYSQGDFNMTSHSKMFLMPSDLQRQGYIPDEYGYWLKGRWETTTTFKKISEGKSDLIFSANGDYALSVSQIDDVALPLYQGSMIRQFDYCAASYLKQPGGRGYSWLPLNWEDKRISPQFLVSARDYQDSGEAAHGPKLVFRSIGRNTDSRTFISAVLDGDPCGNSLSIFPITYDQSLLCSVCNSFVFDWILRERLAGPNLNSFVIHELAVPIPAAFSKLRNIAHLNAGLCFPTPRFARAWLLLRCNKKWRQLWAVTTHERLRTRCILEAVMAYVYGLKLDEYRWLLDGCDLSVSSLSLGSLTRSLNPKGFWKAQRETLPEMRLAVLSFVALTQLHKVGIEAFLELNTGEGWMLPETLRLADYGLGNDDRAKEHQPVASALGARFYDWQLSQSVEESWEECERHAEILTKILPPNPPDQSMGPEPQHPLNY
jgi:hypothetical protein